MLDVYDSRPPDTCGKLPGTFAFLAALISSMPMPFLSLRLSHGIIYQALPTLHTASKERWASTGELVYV